MLSMFIYVLLIIIIYVYLYELSMFLSVLSLPLSSPVLLLVAYLGIFHALTPSSAHV